jgi:hypothetical protein
VVVPFTLKCEIINIFLRGDLSWIILSTTVIAQSLHRRRPNHSPHYHRLSLLNYFKKSKMEQPKTNKQENID